MELLLIGILGCFTAFDHKAMLDDRHTNNARYSEQQDWNDAATGRLNHHAAAITSLHNQSAPKAVQQPYKASDDSAIFGGL